MAESYFDHSSGYDSTLIRHSVLDEADPADYARVAEDAEADCIEDFRVLRTRFAPKLRELRFDVVPHEGVYVVALDGYAEDAVDAEGYAEKRADWTGFAKAFRKTIARVIEHRLRYLDEDPTLTSQSRGARSKSREPGSLDPMWPQYWRRPLRRYDLRTKTFAL